MAGGSPFTKELFEGFAVAERWQLDVVHTSCYNLIKTQKMAERTDKLPFNVREILIYLI